MQVGSLTPQGHRIKNPLTVVVMSIFILLTTTLTHLLNIYSNSGLLIT